MNELTNTSNHELSSDINTITAEINAYQRVAGEAIFEIGRRLKGVRENPEKYGFEGYRDWERWCKESLNMTRGNANRFIKVYNRFVEESDAAVHRLPNAMSVLYSLTDFTDEELGQEYELPDGTRKKPVDMSRRQIEELKRQLRQAEQQAEAERKERERLEQENEELANREPEVIKEYIEKDMPELRDRSFDTPYGVKLLDEFYEAMDELSKWQQKYAWITSDNDQLKSFVRVDEDMKEEFRKNINMWRTLSEIFDEDDGNIIDAEVININ